MTCTVYKMTAGGRWHGALSWGCLPPNPRSSSLAPTADDIPRDTATGSPTRTLEALDREQSHPTHPPDSDSAGCTDLPRSQGAPRYNVQRGAAERRREGSATTPTRAHITARPSRGSTSTARRTFASAARAPSQAGTESPPLGAESGPAPYRQRPRAEQVSRRTLDGGKESHPQPAPSLPT